MTTDTPAPATSRTPGARWRSVVATVLVIVAFVLTPIGIVGYWAKQTLTDTEQYVNTVGPIGDDPATKAALADFITQKIEDKVDPEELTKEILGDLIVQYPKLGTLMVPVVSGAIDSVITTSVHRIIESDQFSKLWTAINRNAQEALIKILEGDRTGALHMEGDQVVLDVQVILDAVKQALTDKGWGIIARFVPDSNAQIVILTAPQLAQVQVIYDITAPVMQWLIFAVLALFIISALLSRRRPRMTVWIGALLVAWSAILTIALDIGENVFVDQLASTPFAGVSSMFYSTLLAYLRNSMIALLLIGIGLIITGFYCGRTKAAAEVRAGVRKGIQGIARIFPDGPLVSSGAWLARHARWYRGIIAALLLVAVLIGGAMTATRTIAWTALALAVLLILEVWAALPTTREEPPAPVQV